MKNIFFLIVPILLLISCSEEKTEWFNESRLLSNYDSNGKLITTIDQVWKNEEWLNREKVEYSYDKNGNEIELSTLYWNDKEWQNKKLVKKEYDSENKISTKLESGWKNNRWIAGFKDLFTYDDDLEQTKIIHLRMKNNEWTQASKSFKVYDDDGNEIASWTQLRKHSYDSLGNTHYTDGWEDVQNKWVNIIDNAGNLVENQYQYIEDGSIKIIVRTRSEFNSENKVVSELKQERQTDSLVNVNKTEISYNEFGKEIEIQSIWENGDWKNSNQYISQYYDNGLLKELVYKEWNNNDWVNKFKTSYIYDENGNEIEKLIQENNK